MPGEKGGPSGNEIEVHGPRSSAPNPESNEYIPDDPDGTARSRHIKEKTREDYEGPASEYDE